MRKYSGNGIVLCDKNNFVQFFDCDLSPQEKCGCKKIFQYDGVNHG